VGLAAYTSAKPIVTMSALTAPAHAPSGSVDLSATGRCRWGGLELEECSENDLQLTHHLNVSPAVSGDESFL
jgi:hypothetical protein